MVCLNVTMQKRAEIRSWGVCVVHLKYLKCIAGSLLLDRLAEYDAAHAQRAFDVCVKL